MKYLAQMLLNKISYQTPLFYFVLFCIFFLAQRFQCLLNTFNRCLEYLAKTGLNSLQSFTISQFCGSLKTRLSQSLSTLKTAIPPKFTVSRIVMDSATLNTTSFILSHKSPSSFTKSNFNNNNRILSGFRNCGRRSKPISRTCASVSKDQRVCISSHFKVLNVF